MRPRRGRPPRLRIEGTLTQLGHEVRTITAAAFSDRGWFKDIDAVLVGASIHVSKHQALIHEFVTDHRDILESFPTGFFQVSLSSANEEGREQAASYVEMFTEATGWHPDRIGLFGGALRYSEYGFLKRTMMKKIVKKSIDELPDPDEIGDYEFTDWEEVEMFTQDFAAYVEQVD